MKKFFLIFIFVFVFATPVSHAQNNAESINALLAQIAQLQQIIASLQAQNETQATVSYSGFGADTWSYNRSIEGQPVGSEIAAGNKYKKEGDDEGYFSSFLIYLDDLKRNKKVAEEIQENSEDIWRLVTDTLGLPITKKYVYRFVTYQNPDDPSLGFVKRASRDVSDWYLAINISGMDLQNEKWVRDTLIIALHEYAHMFTLHKSQISYYRSGDKCERQNRYTFERSRTCADEDSYLGQFVSQLWTEDQLKEVEKRSVRSKQTLYGLYPSSFVTKYAASSPQEDIAESFVDFVLQQRPTGQSIREKKMRFFYDYPELVEVRRRIRNNIKTYF